MKYTIEGFNQREVIKLGNLDIVDLVILRWIVDFEPKMAKKEIDGEIYFWVNYHSLLEALPILNIKKLALYRRLEKMCDADVLKHKNVKDKGNYSYYTFGNNYLKLISSTIEPSISNDRTLISSTIEQNNSSIKETHLLNNSLIPIVPLTSYQTCMGITNSKCECSKKAKLKIGNSYFCGQHARMYLTEIGRSDLIVQVEQLETNKFKKPTLEEVQQYCSERNNNINAEKFIDYYESNGWKVGRNSMKDWKATVRNWEKNQQEKQNNVKTYKSNYEISQEALRKAREEFENE